MPKMWFFLMLLITLRVNAGESCSEGEREVAKVIADASWRSKGGDTYKAQAYDFSKDKESQNYSFKIEKTWSSTNAAKIDRVLWSTTFPCYRLETPLEAAKGYCLVDSKEVEGVWSDLIRKGSCTCGKTPLN